MELTEKISRIRDAIPDAMRHAWYLPPGLGEAESQEVPSVLRNLYSLTSAPRVGSLVCLSPSKLDNAEDVRDDFDEWGIRVEGRGRWVRFGKCADARLYVHLESGVVTTISARDLKAGRLRLRELAANDVDFFDRYAVGPKYPLIVADPKAEHVASPIQDPWVEFLLEVGVIDRERLEGLEAHWAGEYVDPAPNIPQEWRDADPSETELRVRRKIARLDETGWEVFPRVAESWNLEHIGFSIGGGSEMYLLTDVTEPLWRLYRVLGSSGLGTLCLYTEELIIDATRELPRNFSRIGLSEAEASNWIAIGEYHAKARLLLNRKDGSVAGLEPAPSKRLRPLHRDLFGFVDEFGLGAEHPGLVYKTRSRVQAKAASQWVEFLAACGVISGEMRPEGADDA